MGAVRPCGGEADTRARLCHIARQAPVRVAAAAARIRRARRRGCARWPRKRSIARPLRAAPRPRAYTGRMHTRDLIHAYYDAFNRGDREGMLALLADDVVHDLNQGPRETGREAFRAFLARMDRSYSEQLTGIEVMTSADGRRAAAEYVVHGTYLADDEGLPAARGQAYVLPGGAFFEVRDGRIARVTNYYNLGDWIAQVAGRA